MKILMVCLGNICRSPLAEGILKSKVSKDIIIDSAGTIDMHEGEKPDQRSIAVAKNHGIDISKQKSRPFVEEDFENYDYIFCMDRNNVKEVQKLAKNEEQKAKICLILNPLEIPDPYWGTLKDFEDVYQLLNLACEELVKTLS